MNDRGEVNEDVQKKDGAVVTLGKKGEETDIEEPKERVQVLVTKKYKVNDDKDQRDVAIETLHYVDIITSRQIDRKDITGVKSKYDREITTDLSNQNMQLGEIHLLGINILRVEVFFILETNKKLKEIVDEDIDEYKKEYVWIE